MASPVRVPTASATRNWMEGWNSQFGTILIVATAPKPQPEMKRTLRQAYHQAVWTKSD